MTLRIYADFNSVDGPICWGLRYRAKAGDVGEPLDDVAEVLSLWAGMAAVLTYLQRLFAKITESKKGGRLRDTAAVWQFPTSESVNA